MTNALCGGGDVHINALGTAMAHNYARATASVASELPWLVGVLGGWLGLWWRGYAYVPLPHFSSYDWMEYVPSAWMVTHGVDLGGYATWRNPLYPAMLGHLGEWPLRRYASDREPSSNGWAFYNCKDKPSHSFWRV